ncbi:MAG: hypothetical protein VX874_16695 [Pseudomonadota bacterium]|nr:hypothetical protein [Pseudomonadota bacterium]
MTAQNGLLIVAGPLLVFAGLAGWLGLRWYLALPAAFLIPVAFFAVWFTATNDTARIGEQFDEPGLVGMMLGSVIATISAPLWGAAFYAGHRMRRG